ncbi:MAG: AAA family ATPase, partial [Clostridia bacterium]|nr:AAA family ATPase [Clostridia bacterium]
MIERIQISNFALIKNLEIDFKSGFNVLLGETGAGKSIIISAINFLLGGKADKSQIRSGEEATKVVGSFYISKNLQKLNKFGIYDQNVVISRVFTTSGKNDVKINGEIVSLSTLKEIGELFLDSYNQNDQVELKKTKNHLSILDSYKPEQTFELRKELSSLIEEINEIDASIQKFGGDEKTRARKIDMLSFQINEIEEANIHDGEFEEIAEALKRISNAEKVINCVNNLSELFNSDNSLVSNLNVAKHNLNSVAFDDKKLLNLSERLESVSLDLEDISESLNEIYDEYNFDENKVDKLILRREKLDNLKHKYGATYAEICEF